MVYGGLIFYDNIQNYLGTNQQVTWKHLLKFDSKKNVSNLLSYSPKLQHFTIFKNK